jgi:CHAT domain-containing protein
MEAGEVFGRTLARLDTELDLATLRNQFANHTVLPSATKQDVEHHLKQAEVLHFSGHAVVTGTDAALILAPDNLIEPDHLLWASTLTSKRLRNLRLVMLAACSTGRLADSDEDPSSAMARAFLLAGVPEVVAARWDVDSRVTSRLTKEFYRALRSGMATDQALATAVRLIRSESLSSHPYYWAAFVLFRN